MRILYVSTISNTINRFLVPHIEMLLDQGHQVDIACSIDRIIDKRLTDRGCNIFDISFQRSPLKLQNYNAYKNLKKLIKRNKYNIVHTHTPVASACVRLACRFLKSVKVIYTAHGFHFFKGAPLKHWITYFPIEYTLSRHTDVLITINKEDYKIAKKFFYAKNIEYVPGVGVNTQKINRVVTDKIAKRNELGLPEDAVVILSVGELNRNKNHEIIIRALVELGNTDIYYVICGEGSLRKKLEKLSEELGLEKRVKLLGYRSDIPEICKTVDIFAFPSIREGLSVALMEAMASGLPVICSNIRGNNDLINNGTGGFLANPDNAIEFAQGINQILLDRENKKAKINKCNIELYDINNVLRIMQEIYLKV